jgi:hypothetical protein
MHKLSENLYIKFGQVTSALGGESSDTLTTLTYVDAQNFDIIGVAAIASEVASGSTVTLKLYEATSAAGGGAATITGASDTFLSTNVTDVDQLFAQVRSADLSAGYQYVGAKLSTDDASGTEEAAMIFVCGKPRYGQATLAE